jgi:hypothetical protein
VAIPFVSVPAHVAKSHDGGSAGQAIVMMISWSQLEYGIVVNEGIWPGYSSADSACESKQCVLVESRPAKKMHSDETMIASPG